MVLPCRSVTVQQGESFFLWLEVEGEHPLHIQWAQDGRSLSNETSVQLHVEAAQEADAGSYVCTVINPHGQLSSNAAEVTVEMRWA